MTLSDYSRLKQQVLSVASRESHSNLLHSLKELFAEDINSVRRFEQIRTVDQLLQILELRDKLSEDNITPLRDIAHKLKSRTLISKIDEYEKNYEPREYLNYYASEKTSKSLDGFINSTSTENEKQLRIFKVVTERIGSAWRDLARNLKIQEFKIDNIDEKNASMAMKASEMLKLFFEEADTVKWHFILCEALDKTRRKQLRLLVQEIMMMNI